MNAPLQTSFSGRVPAPHEKRFLFTSGDDLTFWGGVIRQQALPYGTPDAVKTESIRVRDLMARQGSYMLAPAQVLQGDVPIENILALLEVARN